MWTLASDVDGTLTGDQDALDRLARHLRRLRASGDLFLMLSTGRRLEQVLTGLADEGLPEPDAVLGQVGTEIYVAPLTHTSQPLAAWRQRLLSEYDRGQAMAFLARIDGVVMQPEIFNTELKVSCFLDGCTDPEAAAKEVSRRVQAQRDRYQVVWSSGRDLDILPASAGKGKAIRFLLEQLGLAPQKVVVAGDTGNDTAMFQEFDRGIAVANARPELVDFVRRRADGRAYLATKPYAAGVEEGLIHFGLLTDSGA
jgi:mannosylfructose-6-phosphate phosphatase